MDKDNTATNYAAPVTFRHLCLTQIAPPPAQVLLNAIPQLCSIWLLTLLGGGWKSVLSVASNDPSKGLASLKKSVFAFNIVIDVIALGGAITAVVAVGNNDIAPRPRDGQLQQNERTQAQQNAPSCPPPIIQPHVIIGGSRKDRVSAERHGYLHHGGWVRAALCCNTYFVRTPHTTQ